MKNCKNCTHWKPEQAELGYTIFYGFCTCYKWKSNVDIRVLDRNNLSDIWGSTNSFETQGPDIPYGIVVKSQYCLVTNEKFGCINFKEKHMY